jgi:uncharacterized protein YhbP (UPF0306 family)
MQGDQDHDSPEAIPGPSSLLRDERTLVLATADPGPWSAPVYFLHLRGRLLFFSSPESRHVRGALATGRCAGSIHHASADWREIVGLQMDGRLEVVPEGPEADEAFAAYVRKFPTVKDLLPPGAEADLSAFAGRMRARLYAFVPESVHLVDNRAGIAGRRAIRLPEGR